MTEVTAYPDSGAVQDADYLWAARGAVAYKVAGSRLVRQGQTAPVTLGSASTAGGYTITLATSTDTRMGVNVGAATIGIVQGIASAFRLASIGALPVVLATNGSDRVTVGANGSVGIATSSPRGRLTVLNGVAPTTPQGVNALVLGEGSDAAGYSLSAGMWYSGGWRGAIDMVAAGAPAALCLNPSGGSILVGLGVDSGWHQIVKSGAAQGTRVLSVDNQFANSMIIEAVGGDLFNSAGAALKIGRNTTTGRSINAGGTINASGADYAEYMTKAPGCETIAPADVCGVDASGQLVTAWTSAIHYRVKSTNPNLVGGDDWGNEAIIGARPEEPIFSPPAYDGPPAPVSPSAFDEPAPVPIAVPDVPVFDAVAPAQPVRGGEDDVQWAMIVNAFVIADMRFQQAHADFEAALASHEALAAQIAEANAAAQADYEARIAAHAAAVAAYATAKAEFDQAQADHATAIADAEAAHTAALTAYQAELSDWEARLEAERVKVDRIAYCGQVPVNFSGEFAAGDYLVAVQDGDGIGLESVTPAAMIADLVAGGGLYLRRVGRVLRALDDGRPLIDVQHG